MRKWLPVIGMALAALVLAKAVQPVVAEAIDPQQAAVSGVVFEDRNGNDKQDPGERGVRGVSVTDGTATVRTDSAGRYRLDVDVVRRITDLVFITKPAGYAVPTDQYKTPRFYRDLGQLQDAAAVTADFALLPDPRGKSDDFTFANVADTHVNGDMQNQMRSITSTSKNVAFVQVSGDLTNNATDAEFATYRAGTAASKLPVWPAVGNHEYFNGGPATYQARIDNYRRHVGPEWYSFDHGKRHFLVIENNGAAPFDEQREWIEQDLAANAQGKRVVVLQHMPMNVPFGSPSQYDALAEVLERYDTELVLVGHEHANHVDRNTWVEGAKHIQTNSSWYTIDHSPNGFRYVSMRGEHFTNPFRMYGVEHALAITSPAPGAELSRDALDEVQVNAYQTNETIWDVRYRVDGRGSWRSLDRSGDFTWLGELKGGGRDPARTEIEVQAVDESGARWSRTSTYRVTRGRARDIDPGADWAQFHGDASHSGIASDVLEPDLQLAWTHRTRGALLTGSPAIADGVAYVGVRDENDAKRSGVHALDLESGRTLWEFDTPTSVVGSPAVDRGTVLVPSLQGTLYAVSTRSGRLRWKREPEPGDPPLQPALVLVLLARGRGRDRVLALPDPLRQGEPRAADRSGRAHRRDEVGVADDRQHDERRHARGGRRARVRRQRDGRPGDRLRRRHRRAAVDGPGAARRLAGRRSDRGRRARVHRLQQRRDRARRHDRRRPLDRTGARTRRTSRRTPPPRRPRWSGTPSTWASPTGA